MSPSGRRPQRPVTLRMRLPRAEEDASEAELEARVKLRIPKAAMNAGESAVSALAAAVVKATAAESFISPKASRIRRRGPCWTWMEKWG